MEIRKIRKKITALLAVFSCLAVLGGAGASAEQETGAVAAEMETGAVGQSRRLHDTV